MGGTDSAVEFVGERYKKTSLHSFAAESCLSSMSMFHASVTIITALEKRKDALLKISRLHNEVTVYSQSPIIDSPVYL